MTTRDDLVRIAGILKKIDDEGIYGYYPAGREIQMTPEVLHRLFPGAEFAIKEDAAWEGKVEVSTKYEGVKFFTLVSRQLWDEILSKKTLADEIVEFARKMDQLSAEADAFRAEI